MKLTNTLLLLLSIIMLNSCSNKTSPILKEGFLRAEIKMQNQNLPFLLEFKGEPVSEIVLHNGPETLELNDFIIQGDSIDIPLHIFDITLKAKIEENGLRGWYIKNYAENYKLPFSGTYGPETRVDQITETDLMDGTYDVEFIDDSGNKNPAVAVFKRNGNKMTGTFLTPTGDYRYLDGFATDQEITLYTFDGNHAFIFSAERSEDGRLHGEFYSGKSWLETWNATPNKEAQLPDAYDLTFLKEGYDKIDFNFPDLNGNIVSPQDDKFKNKVLVLQIFGTWCPNCMDETKFYSQWINNHRNAPVNFLGLAYEIKDDFDYAKNRVLKMKQRLEVPYDYVIAGTSDKKDAAKTLPMLNHVISFPTTIFIDKQGKVRKIHTGFSGPATGKYYTKYVEDFNNFMDELISE